MAEQVTLDHASDIADRSAVDLEDAANGLQLAELSFPRAEHDLQVARAYTMGDLVYGRSAKSVEIVLKIRCTGTSTSSFEDRVARVENKVGLLAREGGTLRRTPDGGNYLVWDVEHAELLVPDDFYTIRRFTALIEIVLTCHPFAKGPVQTYGAVSETTQPALTLTAGTVAGSVLGLGELTVADTQGANQGEIRAGLQARHYSGGSTHNLRYDAGALTPSGGAIAVGGATGYISGTALTVPQVYMRTPYAAGAVHQQHIGDFRIVQRVATNGRVWAQWQWGEGSAPTWRSNDAVELRSYSLAAVANLDLGTVRLAGPPVGSQRWEGRLLLWTDETYTVTVQIHDLILLPIGESYCELRRLAVSSAPTTYSGRDTFEQTAGALTGKTAALGGVWAGAGDADDFTVDATNDLAYRAAQNDADYFPASGRRATLNLNLTATGVGVDFKVDLADTVARVGVVARDNGSGGDSSTFAYFAIRYYLTSGRLGWVTQEDFDVTSVPAAPNTWYRLRWVVLPDGSWAAWIYPRDGQAPPEPSARGYESRLATGGALASGDPGIFDINPSAQSVTRSFDNFVAWTPDFSPAIYASRAAVWRHDGAVRQDASGVSYDPMPEHVGTALLVPPAGQEGRTSRIVVAGRRLPWSQPDEAGIDDIQAQLKVTPRYLTRRP